jgi:ubiquinone/menaquinone biosynthesis C-methylase UbiE
MNQKEIFLVQEGNNYFRRNQSAMRIDAVPGHWEFFARYIKEGSKLLEIGCSSGQKLNFLSKFKCECYGIDPSGEAINYGKERYKSLNLSIGTADNLCFEDEMFDFVIFGFCLYLVDRKLLSRVVSETDRVIKNKGFLGIVDFDSKYPKTRKYRHFNGLYSYKMDYSQLFLIYPHYSLVEKYPFSHETEFFVEDITERTSSIVLYKDHDNGYVTEED